MTIGRRSFINSAVATATAALLPMRRGWAGGTTPGRIPADVTAVAGTGNPVTVPRSDLEDLRAGLRGQLLLPQDLGYDQARRFWDAAFDRHPALIVRPAAADDVARAVQFARAHSLLTAVRGGGHCQSEQISACDGALMIDLSLMRSVQVDPERRLVSAQGGVLLGEVDRKTQAIGLVTTMGTATDTGIAGLTLGGGIGRLMRTLGLACDNLASVDIVTADGRLRHASETENPELFWGIRGGGGNFGVVTNFEYRLHPFAHPVLGAHASYPYDRALSVMRAVADLAERAPDELLLSAAVSNDARGRHASWSAFYSGDPRDGERLLAALQKLGVPLRSGVRTESYLTAQGAAGTAPLAVPRRMASYEKSGFVHGTPQDALLDELVRRFDTVPESFDCGAELSQMGGAVARVRPDATAYWNRRATYAVLISDEWTPGPQSQAERTALRDLWKGVRRFTHGYYINADSDVEPERLRETYGPNFARLAQLKNQYDPTNLFRLNANIKPSGA
ncbi:MAG TPA: FAD-binding oxidoreductase [Steroidobacteraceae bacterium]|nr:FAD-binding oxidoreductase [Steroidobacteraceae bacterium]